MRNIPWKSRKIWFIYVLAWCDKQQQQQSCLKQKGSKALSINPEENLMIKLLHIISEIRKITLQIRLFMTFMFHLMLWKTLHMILTLIEMTLIILNLNVLNDITLLNPILPPPPSCIFLNTP